MLFDAEVEGRVFLIKVPGWQESGSLPSKLTLYLLYSCVTMVS
jgi:hypothetical protein